MLRFCYKLGFPKLYTYLLLPCQGNYLTKDVDFLNLQCSGADDKKPTDTTQISTNLSVFVLL